MKSEKKSLERRREAYLLALPGFLNQLLLLLNSGMVLQDAIHKIAEGYGMLPEKEQNLFSQALYHIHQVSLKNGENIVTLFVGLSKGSGLKEMNRIANIMAENLDKGTDLWEKLEGEGARLWQERKRLVVEKIRIAESKMSFPMGLLLMSLVVITAAPALMTI